MNPDEIKSLVVKIAVMVLTSVATKYHIDGATTTALATDLVDAAVLGYGIYDHWNQKKVPETAVAIVPATGSPTSPPIGAVMSGKVVG